MPKRKIDGWPCGYCGKMFKNRDERNEHLDYCETKRDKLLNVPEETLRRIRREHKRRMGVNPPDPYSDDSENDIGKGLKW